MNRRGFLATLAGALLARKVGPFQIESSPEIWKAAPSLPLYPITNQYIPLQTFAAEAVKTVNQELKWLRLKNWRPEHLRDVRLGDMVAFRLPERFVPYDILDIEAGRRSMTDRYTPVLVQYSASVLIPFEPGEIRGRSLPEFCKKHLEPASFAMAEHVISSIRKHGGAEYIVTADPTLDVPNVPRAALVLGEVENLSLRAVHVPADMNFVRGFKGQDVVQLNMLYGLGVSS